MRFEKYGEAAMKLFTMQVLLTLILLCASGPSQAVVMYEVIDLGKLEGHSFSKACSISNSGLIVGWSGGLGSNERGVLFDATRGRNNIDLGTLGGDMSYVFSVNNGGQIVGQAKTPDSGDDWQAAMFDPTGAGANMDLGSLGGEPSVATAINNTGQIVGTARSSTGAMLATLYDSTGMGNNIGLGTLDGRNSEAFAINNLGQIVGRAMDSSGAERATQFDATGGGDNIDLGVLSGYSDSSTARMINDTGQIVGYARDDSGYYSMYHAVLFDNTGGGDNIDLGAMPGFERSYAESINNNGQIVGYMDGIGGGSSGSRAVLFDPTGNGENVDLNTLIHPDSGWLLKIALDINDDGWIVGYGFNPDGSEHAYLLVPEPATLLLFGLGGLALLRRRRQA